MFTAAGRQPCVPQIPYLNTVREIGNVLDTRTKMYCGNVSLGDTIYCTFIERQICLSLSVSLSLIERERERERERETTCTFILLYVG